MSGTFVVRRSATRMWMLAMAGIPLLVISLDVLTNRRITNWLREIIFRPEDTQIYEPRDVIWAWAMLLFAGFIVVWGLKELFVPTRVIEGRDDGLALKVAGPFRDPTVVPWDNVVDLNGTEIGDDGDRIPLLSIRLVTRGDLPANPWGARWLGDRELGILAEDWSDDPTVVADQLAEYAVDAARRAAAAQTESIWASGSEEE